MLELMYLTGQSDIITLKASDDIKVIVSYYE